jgi:hypothetical protein
VQWRLKMVGVVKRADENDDDDADDLSWSG